MTQRPELAAVAFPAVGVYGHVALPQVHHWFGGGFRNTDALIAPKLTS